MRKTKSFLQYSETIDKFDVYIHCIIKTDGIIERKGKIRYINKDKNSKDNGKWREENKEYRRKYDKKYHEENKERIKIKDKKWYEKNKEHKRVYGIERYNNNKEYNRIRCKQWRNKNPEKLVKYKAKHREFGFDPINDYFEGAHFHHTHENNNHNIGIFIPAELHRSIGHSNKNQESMDRINKAVYEWLGNNK